MKKWFIPFESFNSKTKNLILLSWLIFIVSLWSISSFSETHMFPTPSQVFGGLAELYKEGLVVHIFSSLGLCAKAVFVAVFISLVFAYLSTLPIISPISNMISKFRYLPLTGISFYISILLSDGRAIQVWVLVVFMTTYLTTSLLAMLKDIPQEEFDHARALGCSRWEILWEVVIKGRLDYVIEVIRQNLAIVWMMLVAVESILAAAGGLGFLIKNSDKMMNHGRIIALQLVILLVGLFMDFALTFLRKRLFRYSKI
jgi:ABC-type nitrate/sulfonate/bicarbonate transport system permease component